jgi:hypothetical protein
MAELLKLNLGSGRRPQPGYINVDRFGTPDVLHDLEQFPWPWETNSVGEVVLSHVLEHLGETTQAYFGVIKELYRICAPGATIHITVPHPRHDTFITDPTHVRMVTPRSMQLLSKANNEQCIKAGFADSPLGLDLDVDFEVVSVNLLLDEPWAQQFSSKQISQAELTQAVDRYNNVVKEIRMVVKVLKTAEPAKGSEILS